MRIRSAFHSCSRILRLQAQQSILLRTSGYLLLALFHGLSQCFGWFCWMLAGWNRVGHPASSAKHEVGPTSGGVFLYAATWSSSSVRWPPRRAGLRVHNSVGCPAASAPRSSTRRRRSFWVGVNPGGRPGVGRGRSPVRVLRRYACLHRTTEFRAARTRRATSRNDVPARSSAMAWRRREPAPPATARKGPRKLALLRRSPGRRRPGLALNGAAPPVGGAADTAQRGSALFRC